MLAVIVSFNGQAKTAETVRALLGQVDYVHVVDNASSLDSWSHLQDLHNVPTVSLERLKRNQGIGHALNLGVAKARELSCEWLLTMDQDSLVDASMLSSYYKAIERYPGAVCFTPNVFSHGKKRRLTDGPVEFAITSGNLVRMDAITDIGEFDESLFIDGVDIDFSLRVRGSGYSILRVGDAILHHQLGAQHCELGILSRFYMAHSPVRRYYMYRNHLYLVWRYWDRFPLFVAKSTLVQLLHLLAILIYERDPGPSMRFIWLGVCDFFRGRTGARDPLA